MARVDEHMEERERIDICLAVAHLYSSSGPSCLRFSCLMGLLVSISLLFHFWSTVHALFTFSHLHFAFCCYIFCYLFRSVHVQNVDCTPDILPLYYIVFLDFFGKTYTALIPESTTFCSWQLLFMFFEPALMVNKDTTEVTLLYELSGQGKIFMIPSNSESSIVLYLLF